MYIIKTKSFSDPKKKSDGLRICVMRRFKPEYDFDMWFPILAPSEKLIGQYVKDAVIDWKTFSIRYTKQTLSKNTIAIRCILMMLKVTNITLLCWEQEEDRCHRFLIKRACEKERKKNNL